MFWYDTANNQLKKRDEANSSWITLGTVDEGTGRFTPTGSSDTGSVTFFATSSAPAGWLKANGAAVSRTTYAALFSAIGTTFGVGDGSTTFNLPDLRGEFMRGWDDGRGVDTGRAFGSAQATRVNNIQTVGRGGTGLFTSITVDDNGTTSSLIYTGGFTGGDQSLNFTKKGGDTYPRNIALLACIKF
jgi:phage-related tail fiber protein